jgi:hypothetical protein
MSVRLALAVHWLERLFRLALLLYPAGVRREYAPEMQAVFRLKALDAAQRGALSLALFACREARDLPGAVMRAHLYERKAKMELDTGDYTPGVSLSPWKIAAVFLPFALALLFTLRNMLPVTFFTGRNMLTGAIFNALIIILFGLVVLIWIAGLAASFPVWALPSLGMLFFIFYFYLLKLTAQAAVFMLVMVPLFGGWPKDLLPGTLMLLLVSFATLLTVGGALLVMLALLPKFRGRVRQDWTLLSFFLYGMAIMPMFMDDEFHHLEGYQLASLLVMAAGAAFYLRAPRHGQRILALAVPVVLAQVIFALGLYQTYPLESWISLTDPEQRIWESIQFLSDPLVALLFLPALVGVRGPLGHGGNAPVPQRE